eukprot:6006068-Pyramimonas_sp.AAC.1
MAEMEFDFFAAENPLSESDVAASEAQARTVGGGHGEAATSAARKRPLALALEANLARTPTKGQTPATPTTPPPMPSPSPTEVPQALTEDVVESSVHSSSKKAKKVGGGTCSLDGKPLKPGKRHCDEHNQCHENVRRRAIKGLDVKKGDTNPQWEAYKEIFGCRKCPAQYPGDAAAADRVISEYASKYPPLEGGQKAGRARGELDLTQFVSTKGATKFRTDQSDRPKWDKEFFCCQLQSLRRWLPTRCEAKWEELAADPANFADNGGPDPKNPMRLYIPANLVGADKDSSGTTQFETKEVKESSRAAKQMADDVKEALLENTIKGFGTLAG